MEYAHDNIRVNRVNPGTIATRMTEETVRIRYDAEMTKVPMNRMGPPEEIAAAVVWMGSTNRLHDRPPHTVDGGYSAA